MKLFAQILVIISSFLGIFILRQSGINFLETIFLVVILSIIYVILVLLRKKGLKSTIGNSSSVDIFIINTVVVFTIIITGALSSPLFFLLYFLSFGISLIFFPATAFVYAVGAALIFVPELVTNRGATDTIIKLGSLVMIAPLSYFFGRTYKRKNLESTTRLPIHKKKELTTEEAIASLTRKDSNNELNT